MSGYSKRRTSKVLHTHRRHGRHVTRVWDHFQHFGDIPNQETLPQCPAQLSVEELEFLKDLMAEQPDLYLSEYCDYLLVFKNVSVSTTTMFRIPVCLVSSDVVWSTICVRWRVVHRVAWSVTCFRRWGVYIYILVFFGEDPHRSLRASPS